MASSRNSILKKVQADAADAATAPRGLTPVTAATVGLDSRNVGLMSDVTEEKVAKVTARLVDETLERLDKCTEIAPFAEAIGLRWTAATYNYYAVGRLLAKARIKLDPADFEQMLDTTLPFGPSVANKLLQFFFAVEEGLIPMSRIDSLPANYDYCYRIALVARKDQQAVAEAFEENAITPRTSPKDLKAYIETKRGRRTTAVASPQAAVAPPAESHETEAVDHRLQAIADRRAMLERRIAEDTAELERLRLEEEGLRRGRQPGRQ